MEAFRIHTGVAMALRATNVDTDQIAPSRFLKRITRSGHADVLFGTWREDPDFVLNRPELVGASVLVAGSNFGIGSSREIAVWALQNYGFRAIVAPRFGDIFRANAGKSGLVTAQVEERDVESLWRLIEGRAGLSVTVDLERQLISAGLEFRAAFSIDPYTKWQILNGFDDIDVTLRSNDAISEHERRRSRLKPTLRSSQGSTRDTTLRETIRRVPTVPG
ncbi:MAG: 3-isopropylmalate dehydratase small subunit [Acidimicrobiales bacterium]